MRFDSRYHKSVIEMTFRNECVMAYAEPMSSFTDNAHVDDFENSVMRDTYIEYSNITAPFPKWSQMVKDVLNECISSTKADSYSVTIAIMMNGAKVSSRCAVDMSLKHSMEEFGLDYIYEYSNALVNELISTIVCKFMKSEGDKFSGNKQASENNLGVIPITETPPNEIFKKHML